MKKGKKWTFRAVAGELSVHIDISDILGGWYRDRYPPRYRLVSIDTGLHRYGPFFFNPWYNQSSFKNSDILFIL